jgi:hypothetical protein
MERKGRARAVVAGMRDEILRTEEKSRERNTPILSTFVTSRTSSIFTSAFKRECGV